MNLRVKFINIQNVVKRPEIVIKAAFVLQSLLIPLSYKTNNHEKKTF